MEFVGQGKTTINMARVGQIDELVGCMWIKVDNVMLPGTNVDHDYTIGNMRLTRYFLVVPGTNVRIVDHDYTIENKQSRVQNRVAF